MWRASGRSAGQQHRGLSGRKRHCQPRAQLKKVPKLGPKAFEQCAGFLRVRDSSNPLDATAVHPESYAAAKALMEKLGYAPQALETRRHRRHSGKGRTGGHGEAGG